MKTPPDAQRALPAPASLPPVLLCYVTCATRRQALAIGRRLLVERLVACINLLGGMQSLYWWQGAIQQGQEVVLIAKTRRSLLPRVVSRITELHSYDVPCVIALPILGGNEEYLRWIASETAGTTRR